MTTIHAPPIELIHEIFSHFASAQDPSPYQLALVCRRWRDPAQRVLFLDVKLVNAVQARTWLVSPARPRYRTRSMAVYGPMINMPVNETLATSLTLTSLSLLGSLGDGGYEFLRGFPSARPRLLPVRVCH